jgi:hypothetical protein
MLYANATKLSVFAIGILSLGCENSDGNAIVASKPTQQANTLKSGWQNKNAFRFDVVRRKGDCASVVIQLAQDLSLRFEMTDHLECHFERIARNLSLQRDPFKLYHHLRLST